MTKLVDEDKSVLRSIISNMFTNDKIVPTLKGIHRKFNEAGYTGGTESLRRVVKSVGFRCKKTRTNRVLLLEKTEVRLSRLGFLRAMESYRAEKRPIIYLDETYIDDSNVRLTKGQRLVIVVAGGEDGFIPNAQLILKSNKVSGEYQYEMGFEGYKKWLEEKLIPNLPDKSVLVINNAPYHNVQKNKPPNSNTKRDNMVEWLISRNICFNSAMLKPELYSLIQLSKPKIKEYEMDDILTKSGHKVLRVPVYHPDLNPVELVWTAFREYLGSKNSELSVKNIEQYCRNFFTDFSAEKWRKLRDHAQKKEAEFLKQEANVDSMTENFLSNMGDDSETENEISSSDDDMC